MDCCTAEPATQQHQHQAFALSHKVLANVTNAWPYASTHTHPASATSGVPWISQALVVGVVPTDRAYPLLIAVCCTFCHFQALLSSLICCIVHYGSMFELGYMHDEMPLGDLERIIPW